MQTKRKTRTEITHRIIERKVFLTASQSINIWCEFCAAQVEMVSPKQATILLNVDIREIYRRIELGDFHFVEINPSELFICENSLRAI
jgi:hypothetical protein